MLTFGVPIAVLVVIVASYFGFKIDLSLRTILLWQLAALVAFPFFLLMKP